MVAPVTVHRGHHFGVRMLLPPSSKPGHSQGALVQLHPDAVAPAAREEVQLQGPSQKLKPSVSCRYFRNASFGACGKSRAGTRVRK